MTRKEYKEKLDRIEAYSGYDYLTQEDIKETRKYHKGKNTLEGFNGRASFEVVKPDTIILTSYTTKVCGIFDGEFKKIWDGYSATTLKHINKFREHFNLPKLSKREWIEI